VLPVPASLHAASMARIIAASQRQISSVRHISSGAGAQQNVTMTWWGTSLPLSPLCLKGCSLDRAVESRKRIRKADTGDTAANGNKVRGPDLRQLAHHALAANVKNAECDTRSRTIYPRTAFVHLLRANCLRCPKAFAKSGFGTRSNR